MFCDFQKNSFKISLAKSHHKYSKLNESMQKRFFFSKTENIEILLQKKFMVLKFCMGARHLNCGRKIDKINKKKYKGKKSHDKIRTQILTKLTVFSNFLDTHKNWCKTTTGSEWYRNNNKKSLLFVDFLRLYMVFFREGCLQFP
jgi:hypothetical protein